ncbi:YheC/YheD family protein [Paenibacillus nasutitermitis]|uniref:YheC/YheD family protein n=1 Tax=Paenibacillus nasutitermitis TaxID=1652958 RepID=A0A916YNN5_9BACL|nr:YheC/YheD family protein [Paenibacillus nasutitermitis]GGD53622.1 hypothetical protein GCM10010911_08970 [Paenibacillus nasutitermitis]
MRYYNTKLGKHSFLKTSTALRGHIPHAQLATYGSIKHMLDKYRSVYIKPNNGTGGYGIMKAVKLSNGAYQLKRGMGTSLYASYSSLYASMSNSLSRRMHLVQQTVHLQHYRSRPFDLRVMVQRNQMNQWEVTGIIGRLAQAHKIVTNYHNGGTPLTARQLLAPKFDQAGLTRFIKRIEKLGLETSRYISKAFPSYRSFGIDIAVDHQMRLWILEVNTRPDKYIFRAISNKSMFHKIMRYSKFTWRRDKLPARIVRNRRVHR